MLKKCLIRLKYSVVIQRAARFLNKLTSDFLEIEQKTLNYENRKIQYLYLTDNKRPWDITISQTFISSIDTLDHEHIMLSFRVYVSNKDEIKDIIKGIQIEAQDMSELDGFTYQEYASKEEYYANFEKYQQNIKVTIVP